MAIPDKRDLELMRLMSRTTFKFAKNGRQERRLADLETAGFVERKWDVYSMKKGGEETQYRWAYRLSAKGAEALTRQPA